jgi:NarL family two-component system response regulator LiaR
LGGISVQARIMKSREIKTVILYGVLLALLVTLLKFFEYWFFVKALPLEYYIGIIALFFTGIGIWAGLKLTSPKVKIVRDEPHQIDEEKLKQLGISKREYEVLQLMAVGMSNQEIADKLFVSIATVKTHSSNLFSKLDAKRRTQAIQRAKELNLL